MTLAAMAGVRAVRGTQSRLSCPRLRLDVGWMCQGESMNEHTVVLPADSPERIQREAEGWHVSACSWAAQLTAEQVDLDHFALLIGKPGEGFVLREVTAQDCAAVLALDVSVAGDYPGSVATQREPFTRERALPSTHRRGVGAWAGVELVAVTYVDVSGEAVETDVTMVARGWRGRGLSVAVKAASIIALMHSGVRVFRTGGSAENSAIISANEALGYVRDEEWVTLVPPRSSSSVL